MRYWLFRGFLIFWTCIIIAYVLMMMFLGSDKIDSYHKQIPPVAYASTFFDTRDDPQRELRSQESQDKVGQALKLFRLNNSNDIDVVSFELQEKELELYTPHYEFNGQLGTGLVSFVGYFDHRSNNETISQNLLSSINEEGAWSREVGLDNQYMRQGSNVYTFEAITNSGEKKTYKKEITVNFESISLGKSILYIDPYFKKDDTDLVWKEDDFDGIPTYFLNASCIDGDDTVVIKIENEIKTVPACLTYSTKKGYLIYFENKRELDGEYSYTATSPEHGLIYKNFPLYQWRRGSLYQSLMFFNPTKQFIQIVKATGDIKNYETLIQHFDIRSQRNTMSLRQVNGEQVEIENGYEKIILYYYKNNESKRSVVFPGLRFKYYVIRSGRWKLINQGTVYHLDQAVKIPPASEDGSVFRLDAWLYNDEVIVEDPFMHITYDISSLKKEASIIQIPQAEFECKDTTRDVYGYKAEKREYVYENDDIILLGAGRDVDRLELTDSHGSSYEIEQHTLGYVSVSIDSLEKGSAIGKTDFTLRGYSNADKEVCKKTISINILENPTY